MLENLEPKSVFSFFEEIDQIQRGSGNTQKISDYLAEFAKKAPSLEIKAGVVEGTYYDAEGMKQIASVPSREVLLSKLLGSLQSPITNLARVLNQIAEKGGAADAAVEAAPAEEAPAAEAAETPAE